MSNNASKLTSEQKATHSASTLSLNWPAGKMGDPSVSTYATSQVMETESGPTHKVMLSFDRIEDAQAMALLLKQKGLLRASAIVKTDIRLSVESAQELLAILKPESLAQTQALFNASKSKNAQPSR